MKYLYAFVFILFLGVAWIFLKDPFKVTKDLQYGPVSFSAPVGLTDTMYQMLNSATGYPVVFYGKPLNEIGPDPVLSGFISSLQSSGMPFDVIVKLATHVELGPEVKAAQVVDLVQGGGELRKVIQEAVLERKHVLVILNTLEALHANSESEVSLTERSLNLHALSILTVPLSPNKEKDDEMLLEPCNQQVPSSETQLIKLGCAQKEVINHVRSKTETRWDLWILTMKQIFERDILVGLGRPTHK